MNASASSLQMEWSREGPGSRWASWTLYEEGSVYFSVKADALKH